MLHVFVVPFELNLIVIEFVRHQVKPTACLLQYDINGDLYAEVGYEVQEGHYDQWIVDELIGEQIKHLQAENEAVKSTYHIGATDLKLELSTLIDNITQHNDRVEV